MSLTAHFLAESIIISKLKFNLSMYKMNFVMKSQLLILELYNFTFLIVEWDLK